MSAGLAVLRRVSHIIPLETRLNMFNALVLPYFSYCSPVWGNIGKGLSDKLQKPGCKIEQLELSSFLIMRSAQVICWMNLAGKD